MAKFSSKDAHIRKSGTFDGKSNALGHGGRAAQLKSQLKAKNPHMAEAEIGAIIGKNARREGAAPGQKNYHPKRK